MIAILSPSQLLTVRREWLSDWLDAHPEWGTSPVAAAASPGAAALVVSGLGVGEISAGTSFWIARLGARDRYAVTTSVAIVSGGATVSITPLLQSAISAATALDVEKEFKGAWSRVKGVTYFTDVRIQELAQRAMESFGTRIERSEDRQRMLYRAIRLFATEEQLHDDEYARTILADDPRGNGKIALDHKREQLQEDRAYLEQQFRGARSVPLVK